MQLTHSSSTKTDILQYLLKQGQATAQTLAEVLEMSPQGIRRHLKDLETEELIEHQLVKQQIGRPQYVYYLSKQGREQFPQGYSNFAVSFLGTLVETVGEKQVTEVLQKQWQRKAEEYRDKLGKGSLKDRVDRLVELRKAEGYMAELYPVEKDREGYILAEHHCAISDVAESFPTVCGHELEMFSEVLSDCTIERTHWINDGEHNCGYLIQKK